MHLSPKQALRVEMKERRQSLAEQAPCAVEALVSLFFQFFTFPPSTIIGGYWPVETELDSRPLLWALSQKGVVCALPCVGGDGLIFQVWTPSSKLKKGQFGIEAPLSSSPHVIPQVLLVPLLAFDRGGHRLGYGQGFYDRYLRDHTVTTIGLGFSGQEVNQIPYDPHDVPLDYIVTEKELFKAGVDRS